MRNSLIITVIMLFLSVIYTIALCNADIVWTIPKITGLGVIALLLGICTIGMFTIYRKERKRFLKDLFCSTMMPDGTGSD